MKYLNRRTVLKGLGASVALPWLEAMGQPMMGPPKRLVIVFTANGTIADEWTPTGTTSAFTLKRILAPLNPFKSKLLVLSGIDCESANHGPGDNGHDLSMGHLLTGTELVPGPQGVGQFGHLVDGSAGGPSIDQYIASRLNAGTRFQSIEFGVRAQNIFMPLPSRLVYRGQFQAAQPENNPVQMFNRLFGGTMTTDPNGTQKLQAKRRLVFDRIKDDFRTLNMQVGVEDRRRLDAHLQSLVEIERRAVTADTATCTKPATPMATNDFRTEGRLQMELLHKALVCDLTRVATLQWSTAQSGTTFPWLGFSDNHHELSHAGDSDAAAKEKLIKINEFYATQFAYLLNLLETTPEGNGTMLDNTCVVWVNELSKGNAHSHNDVPIVLAGKLGSHLKPGRWLQFAGTSAHNNLFLSLIEGMGLTPTTFGNPAYCRGPLASLKTV